MKHLVTRFSISAVAAFVVLSASCSLAADYEITGNMEDGGWPFVGEFSPDSRSLQFTYRYERQGKQYEDTFTMGAARSVAMEPQFYVMHGSWAESPNLPPENWPVDDMVIRLKDDEGSLLVDGKFPPVIEVANLELAEIEVSFDAFDSEEGYGWSYHYVANIETMTLVPEPSTFALLGVGALGLFAYRRRRG